MSNTVDRRVVEMRFDNDQFESRTKTTLGTLEKLKNALNFSHASDGLDKLNKSVGNVQMGSLRDAVDGVRVSFSKLEVLAIHALERITDKVIDVGSHMVKELTIEPVISGWDKYADKTTAVQTIMAATANQFEDTGEQMDYVNEQLDKLNWFTDETSYNFTDMVGNIGKFTSNGVALDDAATAMQGIATWAAVSGQNAGTASRAMYQLSQAMGMGSLRLQDWMSIENANMATYEFKEMALETAVSMGILKKEADGTYKSIETGNKITVKGFRESLKEGWLTSDVLVGVLDQYGGFTNKLYEVSDATGMSATELLQLMDKYRAAGDGASDMLSEVAKANDLDVQLLKQSMEELTDDVYALGEKSFRAAQEAKTFQEAIDATKDAVSTGWMKTFEIIFGDYEEARVRWTALANELWDIFASGAEARNELLEEALDIPQSLVAKQTTGWAAIESAIEAAGIPLDDFIQKCLELGGKSGEGIESIEDFKASLTTGWLTGDIIARAIDSFIGPIEEAGETTESVGRTFEDFQRVVNEVMNGNYGWGVGEERFRKFTEAGWDAEAMQQAVNKSWHGGELTMEDYQAALAATTDEQLRAMGYTDDEIEQLKALRDEYASLDGSIDDVSASTVGLKTGSELLFDGISKSWNAVKGIFKAMKAGWDIAFPPMTAERLYEILQAFNTMANRFNDWVGNWDDSEGTPLSKTVENIRNTFAGLGSVVGIVVDALKEVSSFLIDTFGSALGAGLDKLLDFTGTLGEGLVKLRAWINETGLVRKGLEWVSSMVVKAANGLKVWFEQFKELPIVQKIISKAQEVINKFVRMIANTFPNASKNVKQLISAIRNVWATKDFSAAKDAIKAFALALKEDLLGVWEKIKSSKIFGPIADGISSIWNAIKNLDASALPEWGKRALDSIKRLFEPLVNFFNGIKDKLLGFADGVNSGFITIGDVLANAATYLKDHLGAIVAAFALFLGAKAIIGFIKLIKNIATIIQAPITAIVNAINSFASAARGIKNAANAFAVVEVVLAIAGLAYAAVKISEIENKQSLWEAVAIIGVLSLIVGGIIALVTRLTKAKGALDPKVISKQTSGMFKFLEFAAALALVAYSFESVTNTIKNNDPDVLTKAVEGIAGAIVAFGVLSVLLSKYGGSNGANISGPMISIGASIYILSKTFGDIVETIKSCPDEKKIETATNIVTAMVLGMGAIGIALAKLSKMEGSGGSLKIGGGILATAFAVKLLAGAVNDIANLDFSTWNDAKTGTLVGIIVALGAIMLALSKMPASAGLNGIGVFGVAAAIEILAIAIRTMAGLDIGEIVRGVSAISVMLFVIAAFVKITKEGNALTGKTAVVLLGLSAAILIMSGAIALLSLLDPAAVLVGAAAIDSMLICIGVLLKLGEKARRIKTGVFIALAACIAVLGAAVVALSLLDAKSVVIATACLDSMLALMSLLLFVGKNAEKAVGPLAVITLVMGATAAVIGLLATHADVDDALKAAEAIALVLTSMSVALGIAALVGAAAGVAVAALAVMTVAIAAIGGVMMAIGALINTYPNLLNDMDTAIEFSHKVGEFFAAFAAGIIETLAASLEKVGTSLSNFYNNAKDFLGGMSALGKDPAALVGMKALASALLELTASDLINSISKFFGGGLDSFGSTLTTFGDSMVDFSGRISGKIDQGAVEAAGIAGQALAALQSSIPRTGGWAQRILGEADMTKFSAGITAFCDAIIDYNNKVSGVTFATEAIKASTDAGTAISDLNKSIPKTGGWAQRILGEADMTKFSLGIVAFGGAIVAYNNRVKATDFNTDKINASVEAGQALSDLNESIPKQGGWAQEIFGHQEMGEFGASIAAFGISMKNYAESVKDLDPASIENSTTAAGLLLSLQQSLDADGGVIQKVWNWFNGEQSLEALGEKFVNFGTKMQAYAKTVAGFSSNEATQNVIDCATALLDLSDDISDSTVADDLWDLGEAVTSFGSKFSSYYTTVSTIDTTTLSNAIAEIQSLIDTCSSIVNFDSTGLTNFSSALESVATTGVTSFCSAFTNAQSDVTTAISSFLGYATSAITNKDNEFKTGGKNAATAYASAFNDPSTKASAKTAAEALSTALLTALKGTDNDYKLSARSVINVYTKEIQNQANTLKNIGKSLATSVANGLLEATDSFTTAGKNVGSTYASAIRGNTNSAKSAATSLASNAASGLSSSKNTAKTHGQNFVVGFINGMKGYQTKSYNAAYEIGRSAVSGLRKAIDAHSPSKEALASGDYFGVGYVSGMLRWVARAGEAAASLGEVTVEELNNAIANIPSMLSDSMNFDPVISPIVDLSNAEASVATLNDMFNKTIGVTADVAEVTGSAVMTSKLRTTGTTPVTTTEGAEDQTKAAPTFYNTFNITSNNPEEVANSVSRRIQRQVERKDSTWAKSTGMGSPLVRSRS